MNILHTKKFRHGSVSLALTVIIIAAVILVNAIFTALSNKFLWFIDMTSQQMYTLTDEAKELLSQMDTSKQVEIIFCTDEDILESEAAPRFALYTAKEIADTYSNVKVKYVDVVTNPTSVHYYKLHTGQNITSQSIIVASGTECRVYALEALFAYDGSTNEAIGYNGEQRFVSSILAVTQAEIPVACITSNHGELDNVQNIQSLKDLLQETGYDVKNIDLTKDNFTDEDFLDCRLVVIYDPQTDFVAKSATSDISELEKLDAFLDQQNSVMVFFDNETPELPNLESFLDEWGIQIARYDEANLLVKDKEHSFTTSGHTIVANYTEATGGLGYSITKKLTNGIEHPKSVVFPMTGIITSTYEDIYDSEHDCWTGSYYFNGVMRTSYDVFTSSDSALAMAGSTSLSTAGLREIGLDDPAYIPFSFMKITREIQGVDGNELYSHVLACASTEFVNPSAMDSSYGNHTVLAYACSVMGQDVISVSLDCKYFGDTEISNITASEANQYTIVLTVVPAVIIFVAGVYIMVRRKYA